eukprot:TRINITY_DN14772_c0_g1_i1.p1 TRINITY_DN14772_c0_g1~~TRINITY_DN14772_c0_g1_i1.p1  ORF type:complete len:474 (-),score=139.74 TRINITY_DN14772_c0_g1_i1:124-1545(-)
MCIRDRDSSSDESSSTTDGGAEEEFRAVEKTFKRRVAADEAEIAGLETKVAALEKRIAHLFAGVCKLTAFLALPRKEFAPRLLVYLLDFGKPSSNVLKAFLSMLKEDPKIHKYYQYERAILDTTIRQFNFANKLRSNRKQSQFQGMLDGFASTGHGDSDAEEERDGSDSAATQNEEDENERAEIADAAFAKFRELCHRLAMTFGVGSTKQRRNLFTLILNGINFVFQKHLGQRHVVERLPYFDGLHFFVSALCISDSQDVTQILDWLSEATEDLEEDEKIDNLDSDIAKPYTDFVEFVENRGRVDKKDGPPPKKKQKTKRSKVNKRMQLEFVPVPSNKTSGKKKAAKEPDENSPNEEAEPEKIAESEGEEPSGSDSEVEKERDLPSEDEGENEQSEDEGAKESEGKKESEDDSEKESEDEGENGGETSAQSDKEMEDEGVGMEIDGEEKDGSDMDVDVSEESLTQLGSEASQN